MIGGNAAITATGPGRRPQPGLPDQEFRVRVGEGGLVLTRHQLHLAGQDDNEIRRRVRGGDLVVLRPGVYAPPEVVSPEDDHRRLIDATAPTLDRSSVLSYESAAVLHGLPVDRRQLGRVHVSRLLRPADPNAVVSGSKYSRLLTVHRERHLDVVLVAGRAITTVPQTTVDLARRGSIRDAIAVVDAAMRLGVPRESLTRVLARQRRPGNPCARFAIDHGDPRSESPGESHSRAVMLMCGLPDPALQYVVRDDQGTMRADFAWLDHGVLGEFDGEIKYGRLLRPGQTVADVVRTEKQREARLQRLGYRVVRWTWDDLADRPAFAAVIRRALSHHRPSTLHPDR